VARGGPARAATPAQAPTPRRLDAARRDREQLKRRRQAKVAALEAVGVRVGRTPPQVFAIAVEILGG
jgi:hypothetical protein